VIATPIGSATDAAIKARVLLARGADAADLFYYRPEDLTQFVQELSRSFPAVEQRRPRKAQNAPNEFDPCRSRFNVPRRHDRGGYLDLPEGRVRPGADVERLANLATLTAGLPPTPPADQVFVDFGKQRFRVAERIWSLAQVKLGFEARSLCRR